MKVKFTDLKPRFVRHTGDGNFTGDCFDDDGETVAPESADGIIFLDPKEYEAKGGVIGVSSVLTWFRGRVPDDIFPGPGRWDVLDRSLETFTLSPSIDLTRNGQNPGGWHGHIINGYAT